jgi:hypothetical protein
MIDEPVLTNQFLSESHSEDLPVSIAELDETKLCRRVGDQILRHPTHMQSQKTAPLQKLEDKVPISDHVHAVLSDRKEAQLVGQELSVQAVRVSCHGTGAQWQVRDTRL